jgi:hypothetical protein
VSTVTCYKDVKSVKPIAYTHYKIILDKIKSNQDSRIDKLRQLDKYSSEGTSLKVSLPCVTWAGKLTFRTNSFIKDLSGLLYFDIDDDSVKNTDLKAIPEVISYWRSVSGEGWGMIVGTRGLTMDNFRSTYKSFLSRYQLPIDDLSDPARLNIISKDRELYINNDYKEFLAVEPIPISNDTSIVKQTKNIVISNLDLQNYFMYQDWGKICNNAIRHCYKKGYHYINGYRHHFTINYFAYTNLYGVGYEFACNYATSKIVVSEFFAKKGRKVYESYADQFGLYKYDRDYLQNTSNSY